MLACWGPTALLLLATASTAASRSVWVAQELFESANCSGAPNAVSLAKVNGCSPRQCSSVQVDNVTQFMTLECDIVDRFAYAEAVFGEFNYIVVEDYAGAGCDNLKLTVILPATGSCASSTMYDSYSVVASLFANGSAVISLYQDETCAGDAYMDFVLDSGNISSGDCVQDYYKFYTSASGDMMDAGSDSGSSSSSITQETSGSSSVGGLAIVGIVIAAGVVGFMTAIFVWRRHLPGDEQRTDDSACVVGYDSYTSLRNVPKSTVLSTGSNNSSYSREGTEHRSVSYFWDDDAIAAARVDRDRIEFERVISNGGYGQVWSGWLNGQHVAVKMLLPENRKVMKHLNSFLDEVKLLSVLEHQRIVRFLGVAWDSLSDLCLLTEFMEGGDLRTLLTSYETEKDPVGFSESKTRIALHIAHALTYLHSLDPPVLHRDLKSKNILLSADLDARLTDFGVSREHVDQTMTAGVGTSRWMAPEVLMGERYDDKADVFSMGVVLSELDVHALPYSHAVEDSSPSRSMSSTAIVHLVAMGKLRVHFSSTGPVAELGRSCVAIDPNDRPTAAEALYKLHTILTTEFGGET